MLASMNEIHCCKYRLTLWKVQQICCIVLELRVHFRSYLVLYSANGLFSFLPLALTDHPTSMTIPAYNKKLKIKHSNFTSRNATPLDTEKKICCDKGKKIFKNVRISPKNATKISFSHILLFSFQTMQIIHKLTSLKHLKYFMKRSVQLTDLGLLLF